MLALLGALSVAAAQPATAEPTLRDACPSLAARLGPDTFVRADSSLVEAQGDMPAYCRVRGTIRPTIGFEMRLPVGNWNGNYYVSGCGGYCGIMTTETPGWANGIVEPVKRGYAAIHTDSGHSGTSQGDAAWAPGNRAALELYAHRWLPLAHTAGLGLVRSFYGREARFRYFVGCSNGGRMALIAAQRYPKLFHGIISGCPAVDLTNSGGAFGAWKLKTNRDAQQPVLGPAFNRKLPLLIEAVKAQCDGLDGAADGLIARPEACRFDPDRLPKCALGVTPADSDRCFTAEERLVIGLWHQGPVDSKGRRLFGGMPIGGEQYWRIWYLQDPAKAVGTQLADGFTRQIVFDPRYPEFSASNFDFDRDPARLRQDFGMLNADNPDLSAFRAAGGKLIMWHGMADPLVVPTQSTDYYRQVLKQMGGATRVQRFFRLFMAPGLGHCWEAPSASAPEDFDPMTAIADWVERGQAPQQIVARPSPRQGTSLPVSEVRYRPYPLPPQVFAVRR
ncbi:tannase/feruloyl esterase family alpha/beta hydrolase [Novosphingobium sp.]|jgi:feruloyl esterase|uniref:tannase/feruloyl esterase family alpha/beta hydrolase n=1 Tax=Novosphingobium sp. TaxID=1874826 RepID=UPI0022C8DF5F|nr:tannase/feruloyl esterase family alpha/beta hydrolase [Novosphingobium sp.]MCZ8018451.1 tannase/feruloyl esterase family alpha/beta hydrolase [Novosphingobium sp.]MCZ8033445.1 tannase/feruloyl esterase family alpha/beta hydrolase [Novosphingobium sp.]MCZ8051900.1 tannase/feruloyl esterase family alpha/beta hydrolase [Novosphingobium sp.]MCZ8060442.1 tannase/feruloyl esterase family alpha/beta hydrolase [Novosphingobium sp.]MCZ8232084.1 tannase/feruloyl esterase family alpha/beta hydrolase [